MKYNYNVINSHPALKGFIEGTITEITLTKDPISGALSYQEYLKSVIVRRGVKIISKYCFWHCSSLEYLELPNTIESLQNACLGYCTSLKSITYLGSMSEWEAITKESGALYSGIKSIICNDGIISL